MLSIIICSRYKVLDRALQDNIQETIGCEYEIIHIDNSEGNYNIFQAYNIGVSQAQGDILCFMHEDVRFHSSNWGALSCNYLKNKEIGAIGVAGGHAVLSRSDWRMYGLCEINIRQGIHTISEEREYYYYHRRTKTHSLCKVAGLDGVWYCIRKELFNTISYDEQTYRGFHLYDSDICMQINMLNLHLYVCSDIDIEHFSIGMFTQDFYDDLKVFLRKWKDFLPLVRGGNLTDSKIMQLEEKGVSRLEARIRKDENIKILCNLIQKKKEGAPVREFSLEERHIISTSIYNYIKWSIKNKEHSFIHSFALYRKYLSRGQIQRPFKLIFKLVFYKTKNVFA